MQMPGEWCQMPAFSLCLVWKGECLGSVCVSDAWVLCVSMYGLDSWFPHGGLGCLSSLRVGGEEEGVRHLGIYLFVGLCVHTRDLDIWVPCRGRGHRWML